MKKLGYGIAILTVTLGMSQVYAQPHTAQNSLDWSGEYQGKLNKGERVTLTLNTNKKYELTERNAQDMYYHATGKFSFDKKHGSIIHLTNTPKYKTFFVGENFVQPQTRHFFGKKSAHLNKVSEIVYLDVAPEIKPCSHGAGQGECLQVKEFTRDMKGKKIYHNSNWEYFYNQIEGYQHNNKQQETIKVKKIRVENPPADGSSLKYVIQK